MMKTARAVGLLSLAVVTVGSVALGAQRQQPPSQFRGPSTPRMAGTYELETTRGGNPERAAQTATRSLPPGQRDRAYQNLLGRLQPPQTLSIEQTGRTISIASSRGPRAAFDADGRTLNEPGLDGRMINTRAEMIGNQVRVSTSGGSRGSDFSVTFESLNNGANLLVTRRLDDDDLVRPVTIQSYYRRALHTPHWDVYATDPGYDRGSNRTGYDVPSRMMTVPEGTRLVATLDTAMSMRSSRSGEPFSMTVRSPGEFQGARIDGVITRVNGNRGGTGTDMGIDFRTIDVRGRSSDFDAMLNTVRLSDGTLLRVNADGDVRDSNRGETTVRNGAIGATVGAIIGALAGGGKGAAIGAVVGGTGGVILSQGHEQLDLQRGAEVTLTSVRNYHTP